MCTEDGGTELSDERVKAQPEGVHVWVDNRSGESASINGFVLDVGEGFSKNVVRAAPGETKVACWPFSQHSKKEPPTTPLEIVDPNGFYKSAELHCPPGPKSDLIETAIFELDTKKSEHDDPVEAAGDFFDKLEEEDTVEIAGYPEADPPSVRVIRDGYVVANVAFLRADDGGVIIEGKGSCASVDLGG